MSSSRIRSIAAPSRERLLPVEIEFRREWIARSVAGIGVNLTGHDLVAFRKVVGDDLGVGAVGQTGAHFYRPEKPVLLNPKRRLVGPFLRGRGVFLFLDAARAPLLGFGVGVAEFSRHQLRLR